MQAACATCFQSMNRKSDQSSEAMVLCFAAIYGFLLICKTMAPRLVPDLSCEKPCWLHAADKPKCPAPPAGGCIEQSGCG